MRKTLSVVVPTYNCGNILKKCLASICWVDQVVVVDMHSTDTTVQIAREYDAEVFERVPLDGNFDKNRKFGMEKAKCDWILKLDSDEELSWPLQEELKDFLKKTDDPMYNGYNLYNKVFMFNREIRYGFVKHGSHELRLVRRNKWHYNPYKYHEQITVDGLVGFFTHPYYHYNYRTINEFIGKMNRYTELDARVIVNSMRISTVGVALAPFRTFVKLYFLQLGFLDGDIGLIVNLLYSVYNLVEKIKAYEYRHCQR